MDIKKFLHKSGILRVGKVSGTYTSYKDMADELLMDNVYDNETDLVHKEDVKNISNSSFKKQ